MTTKTKVQVIDILTLRTLYSKFNYFLKMSDEREKILQEYQVTYVKHAK